MFVFVFLVSFVLVFIIVYSVAESAQRFLYDQVVEGLWWRTLIGTVPLAGLLALQPLSLYDMFLTHLGWTLLDAFAWFLVFWLACGFHRAHAAAVGIATFFLFSWMVTMAISSLFGLGI